MAAGVLNPPSAPALPALSLTLPGEILDAIVQHVKAELGTPAGPEPWVGVDEAARHLGYGDNLKRGRQRIYDLVSHKDSGIPHRKEGTRLLFKVSQLDKWLDSGAR